MEARYARNLETLTEEEVSFLGGKTVAVVGLGGLGGYLVEYLARLGLGGIIAADGDRFDESNLNRQLLSDLLSVGEGKAEAARRRMTLVNPRLRFTALPSRIDSDNGVELLRGADLVMDAVDTIPARLALQEIAERLGVTLIHGAVAGWYGQVATVFPGDRTLDEIYRNPALRGGRGIEARLGNLSFGPAIVAGFQAAEAVKVLLDRGTRLRNRLLVIDLLENDLEVIELGGRGN